MITDIEIWKVKELYDELESIMEQPKYQRGAVWKEIKKQMLIDSMLRGIDIPKIYLRKVNRGRTQYEVADGQQRIITIREFIAKEFSLSDKTVNGLDLSKIESYTVKGKNIDEINVALKERLLNYNLTIGIIDDATNIDIRILFARLQMGDTLNTAEKRNAVISLIGTEIDNLVLNHDFFINSKIIPDRYRRQDFATHVIAMMHYKNAHDLKAVLLNKLYINLQKTIPINLIPNAVKILDWLYQIDSLSKKRIINKWSFVDLFYLLFINHNTIQSIDALQFAQKFESFEKLRRLHSKTPEKLISGKTPTKLEEKLYNYILAFNSNGGNSKNITKRLETFQYYFKPCITFK